MASCKERGRSELSKQFGPSLPPVDGSELQTNTTHATAAAAHRQLMSISQYGRRALLSQLKADGIEVDEGVNVNEVQHRQHA
jgi:hypothetical protein